MQKEITPQWMVAQGFSTTFTERFWAKVDKLGDCWIWTAWKDRDGYGYIRWSSSSLDSMIKAHRASWMMQNGKSVPDGMMVLHKCLGGGNPSCVNPAHLALGNGKENGQDMVLNGRNKNLRKARGEQVSLAKLTNEKVKEIREKLKDGFSFSELGREFGVNHTTIRNVSLRRTWNHVS